MLKTAKTMTVAEARKRLSGKWLALEVVSRDTNGFPHEVRLIEAAETQRDIFEKTRALDDVFIDFAGPLVPAGSEFAFPHLRLPQ